MNFNDELKARTQHVNAVIRDYLPKETGFQKTVLSAVNYSMEVGGKRLRPMMMECTYQMYGGRSTLIAPFLAAMLNYAYETAFRSFDELKHEEEDPSVCSRIAEALRVLAAKTGINGMLGGQSCDVEYEGRALTEKQVEFINTTKTGALIEGSLMIGAILAGAPADQVSKLEEIGRDIGLAFQIQDDILDVTGNAQEFGKLIGSDVRNKKTTFVSLFGVPAGKQRVERLSENALRNFDSLSAEHEFLRRLLEELATRRK